MTGCLAGTRVEILAHIEAWTRDRKAKPIFWLSGMAGTGKTSIAWTVCQRARADPKRYLGGSFFCSRTSGFSAQRDIRFIIPNLALLLARQSAKFAEALAIQLKQDPDFARKQISTQVERLLRQPLSVFKASQSPIIFVIDALDECGNQPLVDETSDWETHRAVSDVLSALVEFSRSSNQLPVKFIVTSRPETHIRETPVADPSLSSVLLLHTIDLAQVTKDIQLYFNSALLAPPVAVSRWFTDEEVQTLSELANGLFVFAATVVNFILEKRDPSIRARRIRMVLSDVHLSDSITGSLDKMYSFVLRQGSRPDGLEIDELPELLRVISSILSLQRPLSLQSLADILDLTVDRLRLLLDGVHSVVHVPQDITRPELRAIHASFADYLSFRAPAQMRISSSQGHAELARGCLYRMSWTDLHFNVSRSESSYKQNGRPQPGHIAASLEYACLQWSHHLDLMSNPTDIVDLIVAHFQPKLLFWLEVLSILRGVHRASGILRIAESVVSSRLRLIEPVIHTNDRSRTSKFHGFCVTLTRLLSRRKKRLNIAHLTYISRLSRLHHGIPLFSNIFPHCSPI